jgi:Acyl-CoA reductase (LuxC)
LSFGWVIEPEVDFVNTLQGYGRFLEDDYRMLIEHMYIPETFEPYDGSSGRRFIIIVGNENPIILAKNVFLCAQLSGAEHIAIKTDQLDDSLIAQNIMLNHGKNIPHSIYSPHHDTLKISSNWLEDIEKATDIVVYGDSKTLEAFREYETVDKRVWEYNEKFSFGIVYASSINPTTINNICFDFFSFYGTGRLAPKFYFVIGKVTKKIAKQFSDTMVAFYSEFINRYRNKLPLTQKSDLVQRRIDNNYIAPFVQLEKNNLDIVFDKLYGDVKLVSIDDVDEIGSFIKKWNDRISTVAVNIDDDWEILDLLEELQVNRICPHGDMQLPDFCEQYDSVDNFMVYVSEDQNDEFF